MKTSIFTIFYVIALTPVACKDSNEPVGPDLATSLVGQFQATYLVVPLNTPSKTVSGSLASVQFARKNNNTLVVSVNINDSLIQVNDRYDAVISPENPEKDGLRKPGLRNLFRLTADNLDSKGSGASTVYLYDDGKVLGGIGYIDASGRMISLAFVP